MSAPDRDRADPIPVRLATLAAEKPQQVAITCGGAAITRSELDRQSSRLAHAYRELGVRSGDYVSVLLPNSIEFFVAVMAVWKLGAIPQPLSPRLPREERDAVLGVLPRALVVGVDETIAGTVTVPAGFTPGPAVADEPLPPVVSPSWKAMASGGSTGTPKIIETTADGSIDLAAMGRAFKLVDEERQLVTGPLSHNNSFQMAIVGLSMGHHLDVMPRFDAAEMLRLITVGRITFIATVPTVLHRALIAHRADPQAYDLSSIRLIWHGAAPCPPSVKRGWIEILGDPDKLWEYYGGTEMQAGTFIGGQDWLTHPGSIGRVAIGRMKVVDTDGRECASGEIGELVMQSTNPDGAYRYRGSLREERDGWDTIGDLGYVDDDGFYYLSDRRVDMFNVGGSKVYPAEVEAALSEHPSVLSCLVVGIPHADLGQVPHALIQLTPGTDTSSDDLRLFLHGRLVGYKVPRSMEFSDTPLRDDAGKARRSAVRDGVIERLGAAAASHPGLRQS